MRGLESTRILVMKSKTSVTEREAKGACISRESMEIESSGQDLHVLGVCGGTVGRI